MYEDVLQRLLFYEEPFAGALGEKSKKQTSRTTTSTTTMEIRKPHKTYNNDTEITAQHGPDLAQHGHNLRLR